MRIPGSPGASVRNGRRILDAARAAFAATGPETSIELDPILGQILGLAVAGAKIPGTPRCRQPILDAALAGVRGRAS
ncbi:hypothetical protein ACQP1P_30895 [Dactylosporangium sp. CA-052675]|uniref:hypothetical protein n=1 Tax=Dactylosporangium sp. CA-052675 TaxID=3239927 RepID=UPI003D8D269A